MQTESEWTQKIAKQVAMIKISPKDYKFFQIERFLRADQRIDYYADIENCEDCSLLKKAAEDISSNLEMYINGAPASKVEYEKKFDVILHHLNTNHKLAQNSYFVVIFSLVGMLVGAALGVTIAMLLGIEDVKIGGLMGWALGLIAGIIIGQRKDNKVKPKGSEL